MNLSAARSTSRTWLGAGAVAVLAVATLVVTGQSGGAADDPGAPRLAARSGSGELLGNYDARIARRRPSRRGRPPARCGSNGKAVTPAQQEPRPEAVIDIDPLTGTPDQVAARTSLTAPSGRSAASDRPRLRARAPRRVRSRRAPTSTPW